MADLRDEMPITIVGAFGLVECRAWWRPSNMWQGQESGAHFYASAGGGMNLRQEDEGITWCAGWGPSRETRALAVASALRLP